MAASHRIKGRRGLFQFHSWGKNGSVWLYGPLNDQQRQFVATVPTKLTPPPGPRPKPPRQEQHQSG